MTEETNKETPKKKQTIRKASTGAWWKSIVPEKKKNTNRNTHTEAKNQPAPVSQPIEPASPAATVLTDSGGTIASSPVDSVEPSAPETDTVVVEKLSARQDSADTAHDTIQVKADNKPETEDAPESHTDSGDPLIEPLAEQKKPDEPADSSEPEKTVEQEEQNRTEPFEDKPKRSRKPKRQNKKKTGDRKKEQPEAEREEPDEEEQESSSEPDRSVLTKLLINAEEPEECRIALVEDGKLESFHVTTVSRERTKNNIYKGTIVSIEPNLQAAFVDMGTGRNGFLPFNEIHPEYYRQDISERNRQLVAQHQWKKLKIEEVVKKGQEVLVQVVKEVTGNKGANITTYLSLPGRFLVLMPGSDSAGISRKITEEDRRADLRQMMTSFNIPEGIGYIIRTASADITKTAFHKDLRYLLRLWDEIKTKGQEQPAPVLVYEEDNTVTRFLRDHYTPEITEIHVDTSTSYEHVKNFTRLLPASQRKVKIKMHRGAKPIFNQYNIEEQIESIFKPQVTLPSGGSIVIDPTEALVAIDVNSGRTSKNADFEETIFLANMEAATELARQLRLRDLGGLIVVDFIDMRNKKHIREVERQVRNSMKRDKAKVDTSRISRFGLMQISRQKMGAPIEKGSYRTCTHCRGRGVVRSVETMALFYLRRIQTGISKKKICRVTCKLPLDVAEYLLNKKRAELFDLEQKHNARIDIIPCSDLKPGENQIDFIAAVQNGENAE